MNRKLIFFGVSIVYLIVIVYGLSTVYTAGNMLQAKEVTIAKPDNKIAIAHTEIFAKLERPQVIFDHKKHEDALKQEGCRTCHPVNEEAKAVVFVFPKNVNKKDRDSVMNSYHNQCIECHKKMSREGKKAGPVVCANCHLDKLQTLKIAYPAVEFDFSIHDSHVKKLKEKKLEENCSYCHHTYNKTIEQLVYEEGTEESCSYCHDLKKEMGPALAVETRITRDKGLSINRVSHERCLNCHLYSREKDKEALKDPEKEKKAPPILCTRCHSGKYKTLADLKKVPRPDVGQKNKPFISIEDSKLKGVTFDHEFHQTNSKTCRGCHHETLKACRTCHNLAGKAEGNFVNVANAYHDMVSERSCAGCHNKTKADKKCAGCHYFLSKATVPERLPEKKSCTVCHNGEVKGPLSRPPLLDASLDPKKVLEKVEVKILERQYDPSKFPHLDIIKKLIKNSNDSKLANYFHVNMQTICDGCHHKSPSEAEAKKDTPPQCRSCHDLALDIRNVNKVRLISAYHLRCLGCHDRMELEKGRKCADCHKEKKGGPTEITTIKNKKVVEQNTRSTLNVFGPK